MLKLRFIKSSVMLVLCISTAVVSVYKQTMLVVGVSITNCAVELQLPV